MLARKAAVVIRTDGRGKLQGRQEVTAEGHIITANLQIGKVANLESRQPNFYNFVRCQFPKQKSSMLGQLKPATRMSTLAF